MLKRRGQVTIFIIIAILIVVAIALFFLVRTSLVANIFTSPEKNPKAFIKTCLEDPVQEAISSISPQAGYDSFGLKIPFIFTQQSEYFPGQGEEYDVSYLCYSPENLKCINQAPTLIRDIGGEIHNYLKGENSEEKNYIKSCFDNLESSYKKAGYDITIKQGELKVDLVLDKIIIDFDREIKLTKNDAITIEKNFEIVFESKLYNLILVVKEIINGEAERCTFNYFDVIEKNPAFRIWMENVEGENVDGTKIYTIKDKQTEEWFRFAVRGC